MPKFININSDHLRHGRVISYNPGDVITIDFRQQLKGFGVRFAPLQDFQSWNLRSVNSSVGLDTYAPSQAFSIDGIKCELVSAGDETLEIQPHRSYKRLIIQPAHAGILRRRQKSLVSYSAPDWGYDFWFSTAWTRMTERNVMDDIEQAVRHHLSPKVWLLDAGWASEASLLTFHKGRFPSGSKLLTNLRERSIQPILWMAPFIPSGTKIWHLFDDNGWLVRDAKGKTLQFAVTGDNITIGSYIDFSNQGAIDYISGKIQSLIDHGLGGIMFDFGESLPASSKHVSHNVYVAQAKEAMYKICQMYNLCLISRSGWTNTHAYTGLWLGDQSSDISRFAGLGSVLWGYKTATEAGYTFVGMDVGGYFGFPSQKDYMRWLDLAVCMPFVLLHGAFRNDPFSEGKGALTHLRKCRQHHHELWSKSPKPRPRFALSNNGLKIESVQVGSYAFGNQNTE